MIFSVEPTISDAWQISNAHSGWDTTRPAGYCSRKRAILSVWNIWCTEQKPCQRMIFAFLICASVRPPISRSGFQITISSSGMPIL